MEIFRTKPIKPDDSGLSKTLSALDLTLLGIGAIIGAGIFVLTGIAAATQAGPAVTISYLIAGIAACFSALAYAELAAAIGGSGSAYGYAYAGFGELIAWIIGWDLLLEYGVSVATVAIGWSGYVRDALKAIGLPLPIFLTTSPFDGGLINLPAVFITLFVVLLLAIGVRETARVNTTVVIIKLLTIAIFIFIAIKNINFAYWQPFAPFHWSGIMGGAALIFFAFIGFDAVSTTAEEAKNPQRDLPIGIIVSVTICTLLYVLVAALLTLIAPYQSLNVSSPVAHALLQLGYRFGGGIVAVGAIAGLTSVVLVMFYGFSRIFLAMARDGLLPAFFSKVFPPTKTPARLILLVGLGIAAVAGFAPIEKVTELVNIGTLTAFCLVCGGVIFLRYKKPDLPRPFKTPFSPVIPGLGILFCLYLIIHLSTFTLWRFVIWLALGIIIYFAYGIKHSRLAQVKDKNI